ncbi:hypothetical protein [Embleya sp. NPDC050493]|uniref:hypothetical protein n=1 Tax=Embleya sp. NPDC050493 TaxID=3363989 RepID=UPI0037B42C76
MPPAATRYERHDLSSTDGHSSVPEVTPAIDPPWQVRTDFDPPHAIAARLGEPARKHPAAGAIR